MKEKHVVISDIFYCRVSEEISSSGSLETLYQTDVKCSEIGNKTHHQSVRCHFKR